MSLDLLDFADRLDNARLMVTLARLACRAPISDDDGVNALAMHLTGLEDHMDALASQFQELIDAKASTETDDGLPDARIGVGPAPRPE